MKAVRTGTLVLLLLLTGRTAANADAIYHVNFDAAYLFAPLSFDYTYSGPGGDYISSNLTVLAEELSNVSLSGYDLLSVDFINLQSPTGASSFQAHMLAPWGSVTQTIAIRGPIDHDGIYATLYPEWTGNFVAVASTVAPDPPTPTGGSVPVPEPGTLALLGSGLAGLAAAGMRSRKAR